MFFLWLREKDGLQPVRRVRSNDPRQVLASFRAEEGHVRVREGRLFSIMCRKFVCDKGVKNSDCYGNQRMLYNVRSEKRESVKCCEFNKGDNDPVSCV